MAIAKKAKDYLIPYVKSNPQGAPVLAWSVGLPAGSVPEQISPYMMRRKNWEQDFEWRPNEVFTANLKLHTTNGINKVSFVNTETEAVYYMSFGNLVKLLRKGTLVFGTVYGKWKFLKNGASYSITPVF